MKASELRKHLEEGKRLYTTMTRDALEFLERVEAASPDEMDAFECHRQEMFAKIQNFDSELSGLLGGMEDLLEQTVKDQVKEFRVFQEALVHKLLEVDSQIIFKARARLNALKVELEGMTRGKTALGGYGQAAEQSQSKLERVA